MNAYANNNTWKSSVSKYSSVVLSIKIYRIHNIEFVYLLNLY